MASAKRVKVHVTVSRTVEVSLDPKVIAQGESEDNPILGPSPSREEVLRHLGYNLVGNELRLSQIDGYANLKDDMAKVK